MKRIFALTLAVAMTCALALSGCNSNTGPAAASNPVASSSDPAGVPESPPATSGKWEPKRAVTILVPWSAGGGSDLAVRTLVPYLEKEMGVSMTVVNSTGANGWIAWNELLKAEPDGYTIAQMNIPTVYSGYLDPQQGRDETLESFAMVANEVSDWGCMVVRGDDERFPDAKTFIEYAKNNELLAADNGVGTNKHLLTEALKAQVEGIQLTCVHQAGWSDSYAALLGGHIDVGWGSIGEINQAYKDGEVKVLCVFATERSSLLPDVPTFNELFPEYNVTSPSDRGFALRGDVDQAIYDRWVEAMDKCINNPEFVAQMAELGQAVNYLGGEDFTAYAKEQETAMAGFSEILGWK